MKPGVFGDALASRGPAAALGACSTIVAYAAIRIIGAFGDVSTDPRGIYWTEHAGFTWRFITALLFGMLVTLTLGQISVDRTERWILPGVIIATLAIVAQAVFYP